jgi:hypothetical protein
VSKVALFLLALPGMVQPAGAAGQSLMTTPIGFRSGFTEGSVTTRPGTLTIDAGTSVRWSRGSRTYRVGELNVRIPFTGRVEGRIYTNSYTWRQGSTAFANGREDMSLAVAAMVVTHRALRPVATLIARLDTPTGSLPGRERSWRSSVRWALGWELPARIALHCNVGIAQETLRGEGFSREFASLWLSRHFIGPLGAYAELYGMTRERPGGAATQYLHGGLTLLLRNWIHLDIHGGLGSTSAGSPRWIGMGVRQRR